MPPLVQDGDNNLNDGEDDEPPLPAQDDGGPPPLVPDGGNDNSDDDEDWLPALMGSDDDDDDAFDGAAEPPSYAWDDEGQPGTDANDEGGEDSKAFASLLRQLRVGRGLAAAKPMLKVC